MESALTALLDLMHLGILIALLVVFIAGVLTSISPCVLGIAPMIVGYIGGYDNISRIKAFVLSFLFVLGLSSTFAFFGVLAALAGNAFKFAGVWWYYVLAAVALIMGLQLLGVVNIRMPHGLKKIPVNFGGYIGVFLMGVCFGFVASPCDTPVLAVIIAYAAAQGEAILGSALLFFYGLGHGLPLIVLGTFTALIKELPKVQRFSRYVNYISGGMLVVFAMYLLVLAAW